MAPVRIGAVEYLNARPLVFGLEHDPRFAVRFDLPSRCAELLHAGQTDLGLIPSIEFLRAPGGPESYRVVPDLAIASKGAVASVALFTTRDMRDVRSIALDTSSRTSVALTRVMCERVFGIAPTFENHGPDLPGMLARADAALIIGDRALFLEGGPVPAGGDGRGGHVMVEKIDLGELWLRTTGLPFVYAFWAGRPGAIDADGVRTLTATRDASLARVHDISTFYFPDDPARQQISDRYLRDNIKYSLGPDERAGLERFYHYAAEAGVVPRAVTPRYFDNPS
ncbi:MAG TPA: menaquinone biosynthesis protein [Vicinamibacterales bacterium]|nr:menaquinone biosynthesis protein [Vicinamibacterales bacterium]